MIGKFVVSLFVLSCLLHQIDASCFIYPCDDKVSDAKCTNTTDYWVSKSNLSKAKYCECCMNAIIKPGMTMYPNPNGLNSTRSFNSTWSSNSTKPFNPLRPVNSTKPFNSFKPANSTRPVILARPFNSTRPSYPTGQFNSSAHFKDLENTLPSSRKGFNFHDSKNASKIKVLKSNSTRPSKMLTDNSISKFFGLH